ncbi:MAG: hypothetical protein KDD62_14565, partial [Bdellovibrionales bacterium]|nr:hypothetical protein [Bdellovibrionales bacterium]
RNILSSYINVRAPLKWLYLWDILKMKLLCQPVLFALVVCCLCVLTDISLAQGVSPKQESSLFMCEVLPSGPACNNEIQALYECEQQNTTDLDDECLSEEFSLAECAANNACQNMTSIFYDPKISEEREKCLETAETKEEIARCQINYLNNVEGMCIDAEFNPTILEEVTKRICLYKADEVEKKCVLACPPRGPRNEVCVLGCNFNAEALRIDCSERRDQECVSRCKYDMERCKSRANGDLFKIYECANDLLGCITSCELEGV